MSIPVTSLCLGWWILQSCISSDVAGRMLYPRCNHKAPVAEAASHIHPRMLVQVDHNPVEEDTQGQVNKTAGGSRGSDGVQRH